LIDALSDPIVQAIMTADGVDPKRLKAGLSVGLPQPEDDGGPDFSPTGAFSARRRARVKLP
jgi:hypothetical protein